MHNMKAVTFIAILAIIGIVLSLQQRGLGSEQASAASGGPEMALTVRDGGFCDGNDCYAATGESFQLSVDVITAPSANYFLFQTYIDLGAVYNPAASEDGAGPNTCSDGFDNSPGDGWDRFDGDCLTMDITWVKAEHGRDEVTWPDENFWLVLRSTYMDPGYASHGAVSGFNPIIESTWEGEVLSLQMSCPATPAQATFSLVPYLDPFARTNGTMFVDPDDNQLIPKMNSITMNCVDQQVHPGDTDLDGCSDARESGVDPLLGGDRDWLNPWDFYDVAIAGGLPGTDGVIDLPNDYMGVAAHYAPLGGPPYDVHYDRGQAAGPSWNGTKGPDGVIDLPNDILGVIQQFGHNCT